MTHYSTNPGHVLVQRYRADSGKWYDDFMLDMNAVYDAPNIYEAISMCLLSQGRGLNFESYIYVIAKPYHKHAHPIMLKEFKS